MKRYPILNHLKNNKKVEIIVYSNERLKPQFENVGANWRKLFNWNDSMAEMDHDAKIKIFEGLVILTRLTYYAARSAKELAREIDREKPDLILYDITCLFLRPTLEYYTKWYDISQRTEPAERSKLEFSPSKLAPLVSYSPSFAMDHINYPNKVEEKFLIPQSFSIGFFLGILLYLVSHFYRCYKLGFGLKNPFKYVFPAPLPDTKLCLVTVFPELQPRSHNFDEMYKFIGSTIDESVKNEFSSNENESLKEILTKFKIKDSKRNILEEEKKHLIYVSMGSTFNTNIAAYRAILDGLKSFNLGSNKNGIKLDDLTIVVSTGDLVLKEFTDLINKNEYLLPNNILLIKSVPQIELLKRATIFVTHSGQNSVSEAVHYGGEYLLFSSLISYYIQATIIF